MTDRKAKTPEDRALDAHGILERKATKTAKAQTAAQEALDKARTANEEAQARLRYSGQNPDLPAEVRAQYAQEGEFTPSEPTEAPGPREGVETL